jgi:hypothetical protein
MGSLHTVFAGHWGHEPSAREVRSRALQRELPGIAEQCHDRAEALNYEPFPFRVRFYNSEVHGEGRVRGAIDYVVMTELATA